MLPSSELTISRPPDQRLARRQHLATTDQLREGACRVDSPRPPQRRQEREDGLALLQRHSGDLAAEASVPTQRRPLEPARLALTEEEAQLQRVRQADVAQFRRRRKRQRDVPLVERSTEPTVCRPLR